MAENQERVALTGVTEGRIVHYVLPDGRHRPALIVESWRNNPYGTVNLLLFYDGTNDDGVRPNGDEKFIGWRPSAPYSEEPRPGSWHWVEQA